jgi:hypothetical protein
MTIALVAIALAGAGQGAAQAASPHPRAPNRVVLAWLPAGTTVAQLAQAGFSPGVMSAGLGTVPPEQTYLDVGQGNRVFDSLYDAGLPRLRGACYPWFEAVERRAESAPADIVPALLSAELRSHSVMLTFGSGLGPTCALAGSPGEGIGPIESRFFETGYFSLPQARRLVASLGRNDLLIAIARPTGRSDDPLPIGIAGRGFDGNLTSDSTRTDGYALSTDIAPTVLAHFGIEVPSEMSGQAIRAEGPVDPAAIDSLVERMEVVSPRRGPVIGLSIAAWLAAALIVVLASRGRLARPTVRGLGLSVVYLPLVLLAGAALEPGQGTERLLVGLGAPALALATLAILRGYRALAVASALTVLAYAVDVIAGSGLTSLSLLGPNPGLGVRFYGIGNELEALLGVLVVAGCGAALAGFLPALAPRRSALAFLGVGLLCAFVFAAGRFGADVGAAVVFPVGAAVAAVLVAGPGRRSGLLLVVAAPFGVLALLALIDLVSGANAHLTRSVLDAGGLGDLAKVAQRRLQLSAQSFARPILLVFLPVVLVLAALAVLQRDRLRAWLHDAPAMRAGLLGALAATAVGTLANDSGALLLEIGAAYLLVFTGFAWTERPAARERPGR